MIEVLEPSADRRAGKIDLACGGSLYAHIAYPRQLALKSELLADAFARYDDGPRAHDAITAAIHHAVESQTFAPRRGRLGVHLVDAVAARFGEFAHVHLVGLVETDWPERAPTSMLYTSGLLQPLGWPQSTDHAQAEKAAFRDLLHLATDTVQLVARAGYLNPTKNNGRDPFWHYEGGVNWYVKKNEAKFQLSYTYNQFEDRPPADELTLAAQLWF